MEDAENWDLSSIREETFDELAVYLVRDQPCDDNSPNRAEASLPRNLVLKASPSLGGNVSDPLNPFLCLLEFLKSIFKPTIRDR
ncbi:hypothetical protein AVEN_98334-1 [Araneus ventricosus]|uniref:Uncharacterized protein n=1 Tax=Araneus ventricosus TaxID=182803 RepID=A0A4Y2WLK1_ARAVE|nr:hypothetical protein AVEN_98334-1 [Araneus ventricosus]